MIDSLYKKKTCAKFCNFQSTRMAYGVFECKWYDLPSKNAKDLMIIVYRSTIPLRLTAGKFGIFSLETFATVSIFMRRNILFLSIHVTVVKNPF